MHKPGSYFINRHTAEQAVAYALPSINEAMRHKETGESGFLYLVVMDPLRGPANSLFEDAILYEYAVGDRAKWDADYAQFAREKARIAWRTGMDSHMVQELRPHLLAEEDTVLWGSVVVDGIVVAASGANPWFDEAFAGTVAMWLRALAKGGIVRERANGLFLTPKR